jgi:predicted MPP superfamily phosphohydrolase
VRDAASVYFTRACARSPEESGLAGIMKGIPDTSQPGSFPDEANYVAARRDAFFSRRNFLLGSAAGLATATLAVYAEGHARHELEVTETALKLRGLGSAWQGVRIVQVSDIHLEEYTEPWFLQRVVERVNQLAPDIVVLTGDFISRGPVRAVAFRAMPVCAEVLGGLRCRERYAILGNHDTVIGAKFVTDQLALHHIPMLVDAHVALERGGDRLWICGVNDPGTTHPSLTRAVPEKPDGPVILLAHEPDYVDEVLLHPRAPAIDVMLSGHTHGGQVRLPWVGPLILPPMGQKYVEGLFRFGHLQLYVNRGVGATGVPFRFDCPPEITVFTLQAV